MNLATICIAALGFLVLSMGFGVSMQRRKSRTGLGTPDDPAHPLTRWSRAHGNAAEYSPMLALLIYLVAQPGAPLWVCICAIGATVSRYAMFAGMAFAPTLAKPNAGRFLGALGTYLFGTGLVVATLLRAF
ncbi:MAG: MAPEG family protein [Pseudomonadota bacterium]